MADLAELPLRRYDSSGTVNAVDRLGEDLIVRLPRTPEYAGGPERASTSDAGVCTFVADPCPVPRNVLDFLIATIHLICLLRYRQFLWTGSGWSGGVPRLVSSPFDLDSVFEFDSAVFDEGGATSWGLVVFATGLGWRRGACRPCTSSSSGPAPLVTLVLSLTVANVDSMGLAGVHPVGGGVVVVEGQQRRAWPRRAGRLPLG